MKALSIKAAALLTALLVAASAGPVAGAPTAIKVGISVTFIPTSGACAALQAQFGFEVVCGRPVVFSSPGGGSPYSRVFGNGTSGTGAGSLFGPPTAAEFNSDEWSGSAAPGDGEASGLLTTETPDGTALQRQRLLNHSSAEISSWRLVSSHNGSYVELTIAW